MRLTRHRPSEQPAKSIWSGFFRDRGVRFFAFWMLVGALAALAMRPYIGLNFKRDRNYDPCKAPMKSGVIYTVPHCR